MKAISRVKKVFKRTKDEFEGEYKGHFIDISRDDDRTFYIRVTAPCGMMDYDGWADSEIDTIEKAVHEALSGSLLIND